MQPSAAPLQAGHARTPHGLRTAAPELVPERGWILADLVDPFGSRERRREPHSRGRDLSDGRSEVPKDLGGLDLGVAADGDDRGGPHQHDLGRGGDLVDHGHRRGPDAVIEDDDIRLLLLDHARQVGGPGGLTDDVEAFALEDEAKEPSLRRAALTDDDADPS
jgi:hypothetical protein